MFLIESASLSVLGLTALYAICTTGSCGYVLGWKQAPQRHMVPPSHLPLVCSPALNVRISCSELVLHPHKLICLFRSGAQLILKGDPEQRGERDEGSWGWRESERKGRNEGREG